MVLRVERLLLVVCHIAIAARKDLLGGEAAEPAVMVCEVVPLEIRRTPVPRVVDVIELSWIIGLVLLSLKLTLAKRIVVAGIEPASVTYR